MGCTSTRLFFSRYKRRRRYTSSMPKNLEAVAVEKYGDVLSNCWQSSASKGSWADATLLRILDATTFPRILKELLLERRTSQLSNELDGKPVAWLSRGPTVSRTYWMLRREAYKSVS